MLDTIKEPRKITIYAAVMAVAALVITLLAVNFSATPIMAQEGDDKGPRIGDNAEEYSKPYPCSEEVEPDADTVRLIRDGYYAVFDAFWDYEVGHLSNNFCPPEVTVTTETHTDEETGKETKVTVYDRSDAHTHISKTVFSIPESYKVTVVESGKPHGTSSDVKGPTIDLADFPFLKKGGAVSAVDNEEKPTAFAGNSLYWVRLDEPWTDDDETSPLQIGFSTGLMEEDDWHNSKGGDPVQFRFAAVHVLQDGTPEEAHVVGAHMFAFDQRETDTLMEHPKWSNVETDVRSEINMQTGQYRPMQFAFTKPGVYLVQANVQGHVKKAPPVDAPKDWKPVSPDETITSPVQWYTFHVGLEADIGVNLAAGAVSTSTVPITVTATNNGPNDARNVEVEINLPAGLSAPTTLPAGAASSGCGVIAWEIGDMAPKGSQDLTFEASVDPGAAGKLTATAEIRSTTFDPDIANNSASGEATLSGTNVRPPFFPGVERVIVEHASPGAHAGDPVAAESPDGRTLYYSLTGACSNKFRAHSNGQVVLAEGHTLDYEEQWEYPLTIHVSDGVDSSGSADSSIDDSIPVLIRVQDTDTTVHPGVRFTLRDSAQNGQPGLDLNRVQVGYTIAVDAEVVDLPAGVTPTYVWDNPPGVGSFSWRKNGYPAQRSTPGRETYTVHIKWQGGGITASHTVEWFPR